MTENRGNLQRYAMLFGTYMGGYWILKFILFPLGFSMPFLFYLFIGMTLCVPFLGYHYVRMYRNRVCGGSISFAQAWIFTVFMYMFAGLLTAVAHYIYFRYFDNGFILSMYEELIRMFKKSPVPEMEAYVEQLQEILTSVQGMSPIDITMQLMSQNVFYGSILAIPTALFAMRRRSTPLHKEQVETPNNEQQS